MARPPSGMERSQFTENQYRIWSPVKKERHRFMERIYNRVFLLKIAMPGLNPRIKRIFDDGAII